MTNIAIRLSGLALLMGAALLGGAIISVALRPMMDQPLSPLTSILFLLTAPLLLLGLPGMYARQADAAGRLGLAGHALLQTGIVMLAIIGSGSLVYSSTTSVPRESAVLLLLGIALTLGILLTGLATIRAVVFPRGPGILLITATVGFFFDNDIVFMAEFLLLAFALGWIGFSMWTGTAGVMPVSRR